MRTSRSPRWTSTGRGRLAAPAEDRDAGRWRRPTCRSGWRRVSRWPRWSPPRLSGLLRAAAPEGAELDVELLASRRRGIVPSDRGGAARAGRVRAGWGYARVIRSGGTLPVVAALADRASRRSSPASRCRTRTSTRPTSACSPSTFPWGSRPPAPCTGVASLSSSLSCDQATPPQAAVCGRVLSSSRSPRRTNERQHHAAGNDRAGPDGRQHRPATNARPATSASSTTSTPKRSRRWRARARRRRARSTNSSPSSSPRAAWLMVPAGRSPTRPSPSWRSAFEPGDIIIDGGNSYYRDDIDRAKGLSRPGDPLRRLRHQWRRLGPGARLLPDDRRREGGRAAPRPAVRRRSPRASAPPSGRRAASGEPAPAEQGYLHCGPDGAGHFVKMVHNGIEYGLMAELRRGAEHPAQRQCRQGQARGRRRDRAAGAPRVLPVRHRHRRRGRGLAPGQRDRLVAARPGRRCA